MKKICPDLYGSLMEGKDRMTVIHYKHYLTDNVKKLIVVWWEFFRIGKRDRSKVPGIYEFVNGMIMRFCSTSIIILLNYYNN